MTIWTVISHFPADVNGCFGSYTNLALAARDIMYDINFLNLQVVDITSWNENCHELVCKDRRNTEEYSYTIIKATVNDICR